MFIRIARVRINGRDTRAELCKISRRCFTAHSRVITRYLRVTLRRMGGNPAMHLSIVKLSRFIRMMDRSPGRRNLAQFVTRANFVRAEPARVAVVSFRRRKCARKTHELHGDRIPQRLLTGIPPSPVASSISEGRLFAFLWSWRLHRCDALFGCRWDSKDYRL